MKDKDTIKVHRYDVGTCNIKKLARVFFIINIRKLILKYQNIHFRRDI